VEIDKNDDSDKSDVGKANKSNFCEDDEMDTNVSEKEGKMFATTESSSLTTIPDAQSPRRVKREASVEFMDLPISDQGSSEVKEEPADDNILIEFDEMEAEGETEQAKMEAESIKKNKLQKVTALILVFNLLT
jgi:hypothetical protein